jgi:hypothetical protein
LGEYSNFGSILPSLCIHNGVLEKINFFPDYCM